MTKIRFQQNKEVIKVKLNAQNRIDSVQSSVIKNQVKNTAIEFTLDRNVDFGEY